MVDEKDTQVARKGGRAAEKSMVVDSSVHATAPSVPSASAASREAEAPSTHEAPSTLDDVRRSQERRSDEGGAISDAPRTLEAPLKAGDRAGEYVVEET